MRWTNIYAPRKCVLWGDVIGGPLAPLFGPGVKDVPWQAAGAKQFVAHTHYWDVPGEDSEHLDLLRQAVNLLDGAADCSDSAAGG